MTRAWPIIWPLAPPADFPAPSRAGDAPGAAGGIGLDTLDLSDHTVVLSVDDGYHSIYENVYPPAETLRHDHDPRLYIANSVGTGRHLIPAVGPVPERGEIQEMIDSCDIEIASHSVTHAHLTEIDNAQAWREIAGSKRQLESLFGTEVVTFVYPYGDMNARVRNMVRRAGYKLARAVRAGHAEPLGRAVPDSRSRAPDRAAAAGRNRHVRRNKVTVILLHRIVGRPGLFTEWSIADFAELLEWMHRRQVRVVTLRGALPGWWWEKRLEGLGGGGWSSDRTRDGYSRM